MGLAVKVSDAPDVQVRLQSTDASSLWIER